MGSWLQIQNYGCWHAYECRFEFARKLSSSSRHFPFSNSGLLIFLFDYRTCSKDFTYLLELSILNLFAQFAFEKNPPRSDFSWHRGNFHWVQKTLSIILKSPDGEQQGIFQSFCFGKFNSKQRERIVWKHYASCNPFSVLMTIKLNSESYRSRANIG